MWLLTSHKITKTKTEGKKWKIQTFHKSYIDFIHVTPNMEKQTESGLAKTSFH
jgi:hypothetical protein